MTMAEHDAPYGTADAMVEIAKASDAAAPKASEPAPMDVEGVKEEDVNLTEDGGVKKRILVAGDATAEGPETGDEVHVHYTGTLTDGTKFDSSVDRGDPFSFKLGEGRVIRAWDIGVATMKLGEKCILTCRGDYAYGPQGSPPTIPPNATLIFEVELLGFRSQKDLVGDGGVIKNVVKEGSPEARGYERPDGKDEVTVRFDIKLEGGEAPVASFPSTTFTVEAPPSEVPRGVVTALKTMHVGDVASLKLSPAYGYGDAGMPPSIPPGAKLLVELELLAWMRVEDVTDDGSVTRKMLHSPPGLGWKTPNAGAKVTVRYVAKLADGTLFDERKEGNELVFSCDEGEVPEGLDLAVMKMKKGEKSLVTMPPRYGYGDVEFAGPLAVVPAGSTLAYEVELVDHENTKDTWEMSDEEKVASAAAAKEKGNKAFKDGRMDRAVRWYEKATSGISLDKTMPEAIRAEAREVNKTCQLNLAAVRIKQQDWKKAITACDKVLSMDADNIKALFRRAQSYLARQDFFEAEQDIKRGLGLQPDNADLVNLHKKLKAAQKQLAAKETAIYGKMFK